MFSKTVTYELEYPVFTSETGEVKQLQFRRMKAKDTLVSEGVSDQMLAGLMLYAALSEQPLDVIKELDMNDLENIAEVVAPLMGKSAQTALTKNKAEAQ